MSALKNYPYLFLPRDRSEKNKDLKSGTPIRLGPVEENDKKGPSQLEKSWKITVIFSYLLDRVFSYNSLFFLTITSYIVNSLCHFRTIETAWLTATNKDVL